jgi:periplasmic protein TonB
MSEAVMMSTTPAIVATNRSFLFALVIAVIVHIILVLAVQTPKSEHEPVSKSIDITLVNAPSTQAPEKTELLAQENQLGSGEQTIKAEPVKQQQAPTTAQVKPMPKNLMEKIKPAPQVKPVLKQPEKIKPMPVPVVKPEPMLKPVEKLEPAPPQEQVFKADLPPVSKPDVEQKVITQDKAEQKITTRTRTTLNSKPEKHRYISAATLQQQISEQAIATTQQPVAATQIKTKSANQVSANKYVAAQYLHDWEAKVSGVGNRNYPEAATKPGFSATLTMEVGIDIDGNIDSIRITHSSGIPELDEAAKKIVRMSAPFPPLPSALRSELDILKITRVWKFTDESGLVTQ